VLVAVCGCKRVLNKAGNERGVWVIEMFKISILRTLKQIAYIHTYIHT
jgi:hypothetical protein